MSTKIQWTDETWNPVTGCTKVSPGCAYCYAERLTLRFGGKPFLPGKAEIKLHPDRLALPTRWKKPRMIFVNSMSDLFHEDVPGDFIADCFAVMAEAAQHTFQILTKRPAFMFNLLDSPGWVKGVEQRTRSRGINAGWPLPNVWLGVSAENQRWLDDRVPFLLRTPAAVRFVSLEPLLGPIDLRARPDKRMCLYCGGLRDDPHDDHPYRSDGGLDWVICGGESGGPEDRRLVRRLWPAGYHFSNEQPWSSKPTALGWVRMLRDQCIAAGVPFFFKQWGGPRPTSGGRRLDGREWNEMPVTLDKAR